MRWPLAASLAVVSSVVFAEPPAEVITDEVPLTEVASQWGLSETEYRRYQHLMAGQRGQWTPGLDPLTALGVSTDSTAERRRLAELDGRMLQAVGLSRADVARETGKWYWQD